MALREVGVGSVGDMFNPTTNVFGKRSRGARGAPRWRAVAMWWAVMVTSFLVLVASAAEWFRNLALYSVEEAHLVWAVPWTHTVVDLEIDASAGFLSVSPGEETFYELDDPTKRKFLSHSFNEAAIESRTMDYLPGTVIMIPRIRAERFPRGIGPFRSCPSVFQFVSFDVPDWCVFVTSMAILIISARWLRRASVIGGRLRSGCCGVCGYDLRGSKDRCPECGTAALSSKENPCTPSNSTQH